MYVGHIKIKIPAGLHEPCPAERQIKRTGSNNAVPGQCCSLKKLFLLNTIVIWKKKVTNRKEDLTSDASIKIVWTSSRCYRIEAIGRTNEPIRRTRRRWSNCWPYRNEKRLKLALNWDFEVTLYHRFEVFHGRHSRFLADNYTRRISNRIANPICKPFFKIFHYTILNFYSTN